MRKFIAFLVLFISAKTISAQDFSNRGKDFWVGYGYHQYMKNGNTQNMVLYFTSDVTANVTVEIPGISWIKTYNIPANTVKISDPIPKSGTQDATLQSEGLFNKGIHITSDQPIVAYAHIFNANVSGATLLFPVSTLGQDYYSLNFTQRSNVPNSNSWAFVVGTEDSTTVEITPSVATLYHTANTPFIVNLNKGQIYNLMGTISGNNGVDLTGTRIHSISSGINSCKKIAVFSGSGRMSIYCGSNPTSSDNFIQQVFPKVAWGKKYLTVPTAGLTNNYFRVAVGDTSTVVRVNGTILNGLLRGFYYEFQANTPKSIIADKPVMVAQYITSTNANSGAATCGNSYNFIGDPEMIYISPVEQTIDTITLYSTNSDSITEHHINVVIKTADKSGFRLDGAVPTTSFMPHPQDTAYSYATFSVSKGQHKLQAGGGFNAIAYGYGDRESYGYNAGTNIKDLYTYISLQNQYDLVTTPVTCVNTNFLFSITLPYQPSSITWDFSGANTSLLPNANVTVSSPVPDSTFIKDGKTLYVYKIPGSYVFTAGGTFPIKIQTVNPTADGCSGLQEVIINIQVTPLPTTDFTYTHTGCYNTPVQFTDASNGNGNILAAWQWDFGDLTTSTVQNPLKTYAAPNTYNVGLKVINDIGCSNTIVKPVVIDPQPIAKFGVSTPTCVGSTITFTDSSTIAAGIIVKWRWGFGPGDSVINNTNAPVTRVYNTSGSYTVTLSVENASGCKSIVASQTFLVNASPFVNFSMPGVCLPAGNAQFTNLSTIAGGTVNSMNYQWNFGDGGTSSAVNPLHIYASSGPFIVKLTATSAAGCTHDSSITFTNIYAQPKAGFTYAPLNVCAGDSITFNDTTKAPNSTVSQRFWSFSDGTQSTIKNPGKRFTTATATATLYIITAAGCNSDTITKTVIFNQKPTAVFNITGTTCQGQTFTINDQSVANTGTLINWYWNFGNGTSASLTNGNPFTKKYDTAKSYTIKLIVKTDKGCISDTAFKTLNITPAPTVKFGLPFVCQGDPAAVFTDSSSISGGGSLSYLWNYGDPNATVSNPNTSTSYNGVHTYSAADTFNVSLQVSTSTGCTSSLTKAFIVNGLPTADFTIVNTGQLCANDSIKIKNTSTISSGFLSRLEIVWDSVNNPSAKVTDTLPPSGKIYAHNYLPSLATATYKIALRAFSGQTCKSDKVQTITIQPTPKVKFDPVASFCLNDPSRILHEAGEILGVPGSGIYSGTGVTSAGLFNPVLAGMGQINVLYTYTSTSGCKDSASQSIQVIANPAVKLTPLQYVLEGGSIVLQPVITGNPITYIWTPATYLNSASTAAPLCKPLANISYKLKVLNSGGCSDSASVSIVVLNAPKIPSAFSPNGDGVNDKWEIASLSSYPGCSVEVFNRYGQPVFTSFGYAHPWDGSSKGSILPAGVYYYIINPKNGRSPFTGSVTILK